MTLTALLLTAVAGLQGLPLPYSPHRDDGVTLILLGCFFLSSYILFRSRKFLLQLVKEFMLHRERASIFDTSTASDMRYLLLLIVQTCVLAGVYMFNYFNETNPSLVLSLSPHLLLGIYIGSMLLYLFLKWLLYLFIGWIFFDSRLTSRWMESYSTLLYYLGFSLFPLLLLIIYFDLDLQKSVVLGLILFFFAKLLMLYKWIKFFCNNLYGCFYLILYFCALEIIPCLMLYQGLVQLNNFLIIKI